MEIKFDGLDDESFKSPHQLLQQYNKNFTSFSSQMLCSSRKNKKNLSQSETKRVQLVQTKKKKQHVALKKIIKSQKIQNITRNFIKKLKLNNANSKPLQFQPYHKIKPTNVFNRQGIQIPDYMEKALSAFIILAILICVIMDTTYFVFPQIKESTFFSSFKFCALFIFIFQFISSLIFVKMVEGKKITILKEIIYNYMIDGLLIDLAYLVILFIDLWSDSGVIKLIILFKLPECFSRIQKIQNILVNTFYKEQYWGLAKVFLLNFTLAHILSLLLLSMSKLNSKQNWLIKINQDQSPWFQQYIWGYYWGTTIMLTVGFGDISAANYEEAICLVLIQTFSCLTLAYNINCVGNLISNIKLQDIQKNKNIKTFKMLSSRNNLSQDLELKIHNYIQQSTNIKKKFNFQDQSKFVSILPRQLKADFLKQSNKKIFQNLVFFKNLTQKTLLGLAQNIETKICHPEEIIRKKGETSGIIILKQGVIGLCTKMNNSKFNNTTIQLITVQQKGTPFLLSLDFISNDKSIYEMKSQQYSILYFLDRQKTIQNFKIGELDFQHFCQLRDKSKNLQSDFQVIQCQNCKFNHSKFTCPKLHYIPLKKHVIDKYLHVLKLSKSQRTNFYRQKISYKPFFQLQNNIKIFQIIESRQSKYASYKNYRKNMKTQKNSLLQIYQNQSQTLKSLSLKQDYKRQENQDPINERQILYLKTFLNKTKCGTKLMPNQYNVIANMLKDQMEKIISSNGDVWGLECDQLKNYKYYFISYNAGTLQYLNRKDSTHSLFS